MLKDKTMKTIQGLKLKKKKRKERENKKYCITHRIFPYFSAFVSSFFILNMFQFGFHCFKPIF